MTTTEGKIQVPLLLVQLSHRHPRAAVRESESPPPSSIVPPLSRSSRKRMPSARHLLWMERQQEDHFNGVATTAGGVEAAKEDGETPRTVGSMMPPLSLHSPLIVTGVPGVPPLVLMFSAWGTRGGLKGYRGSPQLHIAACVRERLPTPDAFAALVAGNAERKGKCRLERERTDVSVCHRFIRFKRALLSSRPFWPCILVGISHRVDGSVVLTHPNRTARGCYQ